MQDRKKRMMVLAVTGILAVCLTAGCGRKNEGISLDEVQLQSDEKEEADETVASEDIRDDQDTGSISQETSGAAGESEGRICVFVCGEVANPGVYELAPDSRIYQAVEAAGGLSDMAAGDYVNQAERITDGQRIYIPTAEEVQSAGFGMTGPDMGSAGGEAADARVNLNTAGKEELMSLTGIGEAKAEAIIRYRETSGGFGSIEELMQVEGIKEGTFAKIKEDIVI